MHHSHRGPVSLHWFSIAVDIVRAQMLRVINGVAQRIWPHTMSSVLALGLHSPGVRLIYRRGGPRDTQRSPRVGCWGIGSLERNYYPLARNGR